MKRIIALSLFIAVVATVKSQDELAYKPLSEFNKDTVAYLIYNFETRVDSYKGKTFEDVVKDIEMPAVYYGYSYTLRPPKYHLSLFFNVNSDITNDNSYCLYLSSHINYLEYVPWNGKWSEKIYESLKSVKVEKVGVSVPRNSKYYKEREEKAKKETRSTSPSFKYVPAPNGFHRWDPDKDLKE